MNASKKIRNYTARCSRRLNNTLAFSGIYPTQRRRSLHALNGAFSGQKAVVIGMGPSLLRSDLDLLDGFASFACNKIYLAFDETRWRPDFYSINDVLVARNNKGAILSADFSKTKVLHSVIVKEELKAQKDTLIYDYCGGLRGITEFGEKSFSPDLSVGIRSGGASICVDQLQLAFMMGFQEVYLIGIDFSFDTASSATAGKSASGEVLKSSGEVNHFHKDYRKPGETWTVPLLDEQREAFDICRRVFEASGRKLYNASRETKLDVIERVHFEDIFIS